MQHTRFRSLAVLTVAAVAASLAACGGSPSPTGSADPAAVDSDAALAAKRAELEQREADLAQKEREIEEARLAADAARTELEASEAANAAAVAAAAPSRGESVTRPAATPRPASASSAASPAPAPVKLVAKPVTVPAGTQLSVEFTETLSTKTAKVGDPVRAKLTAPLVVDGRTVAPAGAAVRGSVTYVFSGSQEIGGTPKLAIRFDQLALAGGDSVSIEGDFTQAGKREAGRDAAKIAGGALIGAVIGNQVDDGDKGKVIGGLLGGAAGAAIAKRTGGDLEIAAGTVAGFVLTRSIEVR